MAARRKGKKLKRSLWHRVSLLYAVTAALGLWSGNRVFHWAPGHPAPAFGPVAQMPPPTTAPAPTPVAGATTLPGASDAPWALFHPSWRKFKNPSLIPVRDEELTDKIAASGAQIEVLVEDPQNRIEPEFKVPAALKARVAFWMQVYARFNSRIRIVHDRYNPGVVYGYIDFRSVYRLAENNAAAERECYRLEKKILQGLKDRLQEAVSLTPTKLLDPEEKVEIQTMLSQVGAFSAKDTATLIGNLRTQSGQSDMFLMALYRSRNLLPHIESVFRRQSLPAGLARIPFVESSFNARAASKGGAIGIWQFMPETARQMIRGDEQKAWADPLKQTASAAKIFKIYRSLLPDWGTTVTAYNSGVGRLQRLVKKHHVKDLGGLLAAHDADGLGFAGQNFFSEVMAANLVEAYKDELFKQWLEPADSSLVFRGLQPFPKTYCDM